jgi:hypothetical protein
MAVGTCKKNANTQPELILLDTMRPRHTKKQIKEDKARKKAEATAVRLEAEALHHATVAHIAELENSMAQGEEVICKHANRPDHHDDSVTAAAQIPKRKAKRQVSVRPQLEEDEAESK